MNTIMINCLLFIYIYIMDFFLLIASLKMQNDVLKNNIFARNKYKLLHHLFIVYYIVNLKLSGFWPYNVLTIKVI